MAGMSGDGNPSDGTSVDVEVCGAGEVARQHCTKAVQHPSGDNAHGLLTLMATVKGCPQSGWLSCLLDTGSEVNVVSSELVSRMSLPVTDVVSRAVCYLDGSRPGCGGSVNLELAVYEEKDGIMVSVGCYKGSFVVSSLGGRFDLVLGWLCLSVLQPVIRCGQREISFAPDPCTLSAAELEKVLKRGEADYVAALFFDTSDCVVCSDAVVGGVVSGSSGCDSLSDLVLPDSLSSDQASELKALLLSYCELFELPKGLPPRCEVDHQIELSDQAPVYQGLYRCSWKENEVIREQVESMLADGIIVPSVNVPYSSPVVLVRKKDNTY